jgi:hypothetical protein
MAFPLFSRWIAMNVNYPFPIKFVPFAQTPLMLGHGTRDRFIPLTHSERLFTHYGDARKQLYTFDARHNSPRPYHWYHTAARFIYRQTGLNRVVRPYNRVFASSDLHVGNIQTVIQDIHNEWMIPIARPQVPHTATETRGRRRRRIPQRRRTDSEGVVDEADDYDIPAVPVGTLERVNLVIP